MKIVAYTEGVDSLFLTKLVAKGYGTLPLSNGVDNHGKFIKLITKNDQISLFVTYLHKIIGVPSHNITSADILFACKSLGIPVIVIIPEGKREAAEKLLDYTDENLNLVHHRDVLDKAVELLGY